MAKSLKDYLAGLVLLLVLFSLCSGIYTGIQNHYGITTKYTGTNGTQDISERIEGLGIIESLSDFTTAASRLVTPTCVSFTNCDVVGAILQGISGIIGTVIGTFSFPFEILAIVMNFYELPSIIYQGLGLIIFIYLIFTWLNSRKPYSQLWGTKNANRNPKYNECNITKHYRLH